MAGVVAVAVIMAVFFIYWRRKRRAKVNDLDKIDVVKYNASYACDNEAGKCDGSPGSELDPAAGGGPGNVAITERPSGAATRGAPLRGSPLPSVRLMAAAAAEPATPVHRRAAGNNMISELLLPSSKARARMGSRMPSSDCSAPPTVGPPGAASIASTSKVGRTAEGTEEEDDAGFDIDSVIGAYKRMAQGSMFMGGLGGMRKASLRLGLGGTSSKASTRPSGGSKQASAAGMSPSGLSVLHRGDPSMISPFAMVEKEQASRPIAAETQASSRGEASSSSPRAAKWSIEERRPLGSDSLSSPPGVSREAYAAPPRAMTGKVAELEPKPEVEMHLDWER